MQELIQGMYNQNITRIKDITILSTVMIKQEYFYIQAYPEDSSCC